MKARAQNSKASMWGCGTLILIVIIYSIVNSIIKSNDEKALSAIITNAELYGAMSGNYKAGTATLPIKAVAVQNRETPGPKGEQFEYTTEGVPSKMLAKSIKEINTIIQYKKRTEMTGTYKSGKAAYSRYIDVSIINTASADVIAMTTFIGAPPKELYEGDEPYGEWPYFDIEDYIADLGRGVIVTPSPDISQLIDNIERYGAMYVKKDVISKKQPLP